MNFDRAVCYQAMRSRDDASTAASSSALYDGHLCRPICPAPTPKLQNVDFYPCGCAEAGFRPAVVAGRTAPGTPAWIGIRRSCARVAADPCRRARRGRRRRARGALGIGARQLRRLFEHTSARRRPRSRGRGASTARARCSINRTCASRRSRSRPGFAAYASSTTLCARRSNCRRARYATNDASRRRPRRR